MRKTTHLNTGLTAAAFLLIGTLAVAQTAPTARTVKPREASSGQASGRQDQYGHASGVAAPQSTRNTAQRKSGSIIVLDREAQTGQASGNLQRKNGAINSADFPRSMNARNSAHATESVSPSNSSKKGENPLYEESGKSGTNPLYESGKQAAAKPNTKGTDVVEYKDGEDMQMRNAATTPKQESGPAQQQKKHIAGVKYNNRTAAGNDSSSGQNTPDSPTAK